MRQKRLLGPCVSSACLEGTRTAARRIAMPRSCASVIRDICSCCQPRVDPSIRVRRRSSAHTTARYSPDGAGGSWANGQWLSGGLEEPLRRESLVQSDEESVSDDSSDDANSSFAERLQKAAKRRGKAKRREKRRERRGAEPAVADQPRARRQSEAVVQQAAGKARASTRRRSSAPVNVARAGSRGSARVDEELCEAIAVALGVPWTTTQADAPEVLILQACRQLGIPLNDSTEFYRDPAAMATATQEVARALGLKAKSGRKGSGSSRRKASDVSGTATVAQPAADVPAWRVGAVDVLNLQQQQQQAQEPRRERRRSRGKVQ
jgi:hypothetical protein